MRDSSVIDFYYENGQWESFTEDVSEMQSVCVEGSGVRKQGI